MPSPSPYEHEPAGLEVRVNFGVFAGRDATSAELEELGKLLVPEAGEVSIVGEERHEFVGGRRDRACTRCASPSSPENVPDDPGERKEFCERLVDARGDLGPPVHQRAPLRDHRPLDELSLL